MSACVSPPHDNTSHMVDVAAIIAQAASTALPPFWKAIAPAVAASGLPVIAIQWLPYSGGFWVFESERIAIGETDWPSASGACVMSVTAAVRIAVAKLCLFMTCLRAGVGGRPAAV